MIAYFDSSSIVKWFFDEQFADASREVKKNAKVVLTSLIAFPEVLSAFNRARKGGRCTKSEMGIVRDEFLRIWPQFQFIRVNEELIQETGKLIFKHNLMGFDAVHLASALVLKQEDADIGVFFSCFDQNLNQAARREGFLTHE